MAIAQWQIEMAARLAPPVAGIVEHSTPVLSFGDPLRAEVATLGINPSRQEFYSTTGVLLSGGERRLATADSLGATPGQPLTANQAREVVADCNSYFDRNPYDYWFRPLDTLLSQAFGASYPDGTACHLDLVQWATDPVWGKLPDRASAELLLAEGRPHLKRLLSRSSVRLVLLNGTEVVRQVGHAELAQLHEVKQIPVGSRPCRLFAGEGLGINYVGWSTNLQSSFGVSNEFKQRLTREVQDLAAGLVAAAAPEPASPPGTGAGLKVDSDGFLPRGIKANGKREFADLLLHWYQSSQAITIGDVGSGSYRGRPWITVDLGSHQAELNADTNRAGVAAYLEHVRRLGPELPWQVIAGRRGTVSKVVFSGDPAHAAGWYLYLRPPLTQPAQL
jgi:hypothetical protein